MRFFLVLSFLSYFMISCQTIEITENKFKCSQLDWFEVGRSDGLQGRPSESFQEKKAKCDGFKEDLAVSYGNGWYAGVDEFCSLDNGFAFGRSGYEYKNVCPSSKEKTFLKAYFKGKKVFEYESKNREIAQELVQLGQGSEALEPMELKKKLKMMNALETELELNKALIAEIQKDEDSSLSQ